MFMSARRERVGKPAERLAADHARPHGDVVPLGGGQPPVQPRDVALERDLTLKAAERGGVRCVVLSHFAEHRAGAGDVRDPDRRDFPFEALEELADARNYMVWGWSHEISQETVDTDALDLISEALMRVAQAFDATMRVRDLKAAA